MIAQREFRFRAYEDAGGNTRTGMSFVASRLGPDILLADVTVTRRAREAETANPGGGAGRGTTTRSTATISTTGSGASSTTWCRRS